jgi:hypothetical protein
VILSLASYSILATVFIIVKLVTIPKPVEYPLLEALPDLEGDNPGASKRRSQVQMDEKRVAQLNAEPVPEKLRVALGGTVRVGEVEVTPVAVERHKVAVWVDTFQKPERCEADSLILTLKIKNLSSDQAFFPIDNYFDRNYEYFDGSLKTRDGPQPMTILVAGDSRFFGGPAVWVPRTVRTSRKQVFRQWPDLPGRKNLDGDPLGPGQSLVTTIATDGNDPRLEKHLQSYEGRLQWRVQVRRGLVDLGNRRVPATAIIGVDFAAADVVRTAAPPRDG